MERNTQNSLPVPFSGFERLAYLLGRTIILFSVVYIPIIFYPQTWQHYGTPKDVSLEFLVLMLVGCWAVIACGRRFIGSVVSTPAAFFFLFVMTSTLFAVNLAEAYETVLFSATCMTIMIMVPKFFTRADDFKVFTFLLGLVCILVDIYALAQWYNWEWFFFISQHFGVEKYTEKPVSFMGNENFTADFLNMALPVCLMMIFCHRKQAGAMVFYTLTSLLNFITMLYIDCNASYAGFLASLPLVFVLLAFFRLVPWCIRSNLTGLKRETLEQRFRYAVVVGILLVSVAGTLTASIPNPLRFKFNTIASWVDVDDDNIPDGVPPVIFRLQCMDAAIRNIIDTPLFGIGPGNFKVMHPYFENQLERKVLGEETLARTVHNDHLYHAVEFGIFGLLGFYWLVGTGLYCGIRSLGLIRRVEFSGDMTQQETKIPLKENDRTFFFYLQIGLFGALVTAVVSTAFSQTFVTSASASTYWIFTGVTTAAFQTLHRVVNGLRQPVYGTTALPLTPLQRLTRYIPIPVRAAVFCIVLLPAGVLLQYKIIGESFLKTAMNVHEISTPVEGGDFNLPDKYRKIFELFDKAMEYYPYQMETYYILGRYYIDVILEIDASKDPLAENSISPERIQRLQYLGINSNEHRQYTERGIVALQTDIFMNPNYKWAHNNLGVLYDKLPNFAYSTAAYNRVFRIDYEQIFAHYNMGLGYLRKGDFAKAVKSLETSLFIDSTRVDIYPYMAECYLQLKDFQRTAFSLDYYLYADLRKKLMDMKTNLPQARLEPLAAALESQDVYNALLEYNRIASYNDERMYQLYSRLAYSMLSENQASDPLALTAIRKAGAVKKDHLDPDLLGLHGNIAYLGNQFDEAALMYEQYLRVNPNKNEIRRQLAQIYINTNNIDRALRTYYLILSNPETKPDTGDYVMYYRLQLSAKRPMDEIYPYIEKAIESGGNAVRDVIVNIDFKNDWGVLLQHDSAVLQMLGPDYAARISGEAQPSATETVSEAFVSPTVQQDFEAGQTIQNEK